MNLERERGFAATLINEEFQSRDPNKSYAEACYFIEKELHQTITPDYPVAKFLAQIQLMNEDFRRQKRDMDRARRKGKFHG